MKIIHIVNSIYGKNSNIGFRTSIVNKYLAKENIDYLVFVRDSTIDDKNIFKVQFGGAIIPRALNFYRIKFNHSFNHRKYDLKYFELMFLMRYKKALLKENPENTIIHLWEFSSKIIDFVKSLGFKVLLEVPIAPEAYGRELHARGFFGHIGLPDNDIHEAEIFSKVDYILAPSLFVKETIINFFGVGEDKIYMSPFGANLPEEGKKYASNIKNINFGFLGGTSPRKGTDYLLKAFNNDFKKDKLHICGRCYKINSHMNPNVIFHGYVNPEEHLPKFDVYVFPTLLEGSAKSIYEAMAHGIPVITTYNAGSVIEDGIDGFIVPIGNVESLKKSMLFFKNNPEAIQQMGENARKKIQSNYTWEHYSKRVFQIYKDILGCN